MEYEFDGEDIIEPINQNEHYNYGLDDVNRVEITIYNDSEI